jgi:hypothetical protein
MSCIFKPFNAIFLRQERRRNKYFAEMAELGTNLSQKFYQGGSLQDKRASLE